MLSCAKSQLAGECRQADEVLQLQLDALQETSMCGKQQTVSETLQQLSSEESSEEIVTR